MRSLICSQSCVHICIHQRGVQLCRCACESISGRCSFRFSLSPRMTKTMCEYLFLTKLGYWVLDMRASLTNFWRELVFEPQLDQKKISTPGFLHCMAPRESNRPSTSNFKAHLQGRHQLEVNKNPVTRKYFWYFCALNWYSIITFMLLCYHD